MLAHLYFKNNCRNWDIIRYALQAKKAKKRNDDDRKIYFVAMIWEDAELTTLNQIISFTKSSTQLVLNFYIILKNESDYGGISYSIFCYNC